jgi:hypothetical protein
VYHCLGERKMALKSHSWQNYESSVVYDWLKVLDNEIILNDILSNLMSREAANLGLALFRNEDVFEEFEKSVRVKFRTKLQAFVFSSAHNSLHKALLLRVDWTDISNMIDTEPLERLRACCSRRGAYSDPSSSEEPCWNLIADKLGGWVLDELELERDRKN